MAQKEYIDSVNGKKIFAERAGYTKNGENIDEALTDLATNVKEIIAGDNISITSNTTSTVITTTVNSGPTGACGPKGFCGPKGACGPQGSKGDKGFCGPQGLKGDKGFCGPQGSKGDKGFCGPQGVGGSGGNQGATGPNGFCGPKGLTGATGATGPNGFCGPQGIGGAKGFCGPNGFCGPQGIGGAKGFCGPGGVRGICGPYGFCGPLGFCGPRGKLWSNWTYTRGSGGSKTTSGSYQPFDTWGAYNRGVIAVYKFSVASTSVITLQVQLTNTTDSVTTSLPFIACKDYHEATWMTFLKPNCAYTVYVKSSDGTATTFYWGVNYINLNE